VPDADPAVVECCSERAEAAADREAIDALLTDLRARRRRAYVGGGAA
jgi:hypothetical protein